LDGLKSAGLDGVWIERFEDLQDPMDIENVKPEVLAFLDAAKERGEHVLIEINPNRTPIKHPWFIKSAKKEGQFTDYYIWRRSPNNWVSRKEFLSSSY
jgi:glycosidase